MDKQFWNDFVEEVKKTVKQYDSLLSKLETWAADPTNTASDEDVQMFKDGQYTVELLFDDNIAYTAGRNGQEITNQHHGSRVHGTTS